MSKHQYLASIRANSAYPVYRGVINTITLLFYIIAGLTAAGALIGGLGTLFHSFITGLGVLLFGLVMAAIYFFLARFFKEASLILADIGDSIVDANSRQAPGVQGYSQAL